MTTETKYINKLQGSRVLIFGGSSGFGLAVAEASIEHGATVIIAGSSQDKLDKAVSRLKDRYADMKPGQLTSAVVDLSALEGLDTRLEALLKDATSGGADRIDHIVFTADSHFTLPKLDKTTTEDVDRVLRIKVYAATILAKVIAATTYVKRSASSSLTFTNGANGHRPIEGWFLAAMASTALEGFVRGLAVDMAPLRVNLVTAGPVATELLLSLPQQYLDKYAQQSLLKTIGTPEDIAEAYIYIMKDHYITGSVHFSEGGRRIV